MPYLSSSMSSGRTLGRLVALAAALAGLLIAGVGSAHAAYTGFEPFSVNAPVEFRVGGTGGGQLVTNSTTGAGHANLWAQNSGSWSLVSRRFDKGSINDWCHASVLVNAHSAWRQVNFEAIDAVSGTYAYVQRYSLTGYQQLTTPRFRASAGSIKMRVVLLGDGVNRQTLDVDDLKLDCYYIQ